MSIFETYAKLKQHERASDAEREQLAADRARRIRALAATMMVMRHLETGMPVTDYTTWCLRVSTQAIDALDALPVPEVSK